MNHFNALRGDEPNEPPILWNIEPTAAHPPKTSPVISVIMGRLNHHAIDKVYVEVQPSGFPVEYKSESVPDPDTTSIKSIDDDEMGHLLEFFHPEHDEDLLYVDIQMLQA